MRYCVKKDSTILVDGSENSKEIMLENALNCGFTKDEVEIITEDEFQKRLEKVQVVKVPTEQEKLNAQLLQQNAEIKVQLKEQQELSATLALQIAGLKGGVI